MDIEGLGEAIVEQLVESKMLEDYGDIYRLTVDKVEKLERMARRSAQNLLDAVNNSKENSLSRLISLTLPSPCSE